jgi:stage II sporulation protein AA (anti-sigma F factor antagonist)
VSHLRTFKLIERDLRPGCREIQVEGELDLAVIGELEEGLARAGECRHLLIGLERCEFIDSTGLATLLRAHYQFAERGGGVVVYAPSDQVLRILSVTGLTSNGMVFEGVEEALSALQG